MTLAHENMAAELIENYLKSQKSQQVTTPKAFKRNTADLPA